MSAGARAVAGVLGVWSWHGRNGHDALAMLPDWDLVTLKEGRQVYVVFDSDVMLKEPVRLAMERMGAALKRRGASVAYVSPPGREGWRRRLPRNIFFCRNVLGGHPGPVDPAP